MEDIEELKAIVVLIDADNAQLSKLKPVLDDISTHGRIVVKKAYGNWKSSTLKHWEKELNKLAIKPVQQFAYVTGKNATDIAMVIDAMDMLHTKMYDAFVLVSSDSDFTPLAIRLRESGVYVFGAGDSKTSQSFKNACDEFVLVEYLSGDKNNKQETLIDNKVKTQEVEKEKEKIYELERVNIEDIHELLRIAYDKYQDDYGMVNVSSAGTYIKRVMPDFNPRTYGFTKLPELVEEYPDRYEIKRYKGKGTVTIIAYRCL